MLDVRRNIFYSARGNANLIKALALALYVKKNFVSSAITNYSINKIRNITGLSYSAIQRRINTLKQYGFIELTGKHKPCLVFKRIASRCKHCNIDLTKCVFSSVKDLEKSLFAMFLIEIQKRKDFAKHTIQSANNPKSLKEAKEAKKICKRYGYGKEFKEYGISYKTIANKMGVCLQKAFEIVKFAITNRMIVKIKKQDQYYEKGIKFSNKYCEFDNITFITNNNAYKIYANRYSLVV